MSHPLNQSFYTETSSNDHRRIPTDRGAVMTGEDHAQIPDHIQSDVQPSKQQSTISGSANRILGPHEMGDTIVALVELECTAVGFKKLDKERVYKAEWAMLDMFEVEHGPGRQMLKQLRSQYRVGVANATGEHPLPDLGDVGYMDENFVVLTPAEVAESKGDGRPLIPAPKTMVVIYENGSRASWPNDFEKGAPRPVVGVGDVKELLDHETGETLTEGGGSDAVTTSVGSEGLDVTANAGDSSDFDDLDPADGDVVDDFEAPDPATAERIAAADRDAVLGAGRAIVEAASSEQLATWADFLSASVAKVKMAINGVTDIRYLQGLLSAEQSGPNKARPAVVAAITARIDDLNSGAG